MWVVLASATAKPLCAEFYPNLFIFIISLCHLDSLFKISELRTNQWYQQLSSHELWLQFKFRPAVLVPPFFYFKMCYSQIHHQEFQESLKRSTKWVIKIQYLRRILVDHIGNAIPSHKAQNIVETSQKYFQSFISIEILPQHFCQLFQNISL